MSPKDQEKLFKKEYAAQLLVIAKGDLGSAKVLLASCAGRQENVCFHAHQAIEKALKAVLVWLQIPVPLVHDLGVLVAKLPGTIDRDFGYELISLNDFASIRRYQEGADVFTPQELKAIVETAAHIVEWAVSVSQ